MSLMETRMMGDPRLLNPSPKPAETSHVPRRTTARVQAIFETMEEQHGCTDPKAVATALHEDLGGHISPPHLERLFLRMPTKEFLYEGAQETISSLLEQGDQVRIWTQGHEKAQLYKAALAGFGDIRRELPPEQRQNFTITAARDKIATLDSLIGTITDSGVNTIYIVDDKAKNIAAVNDVIEKMREEGSLAEDTTVNPIWINQGRTKGKVPPEYTFDSFTQQFHTIEDIRELTHIHPQNEKAVTQWLIDLDHTLLHTAAAKQSLFEKVSALYPEEVSLLPDKVRRLAGITEQITSVTELVSGMSPNTVVHVTTEQGEQMVVKHNTFNPEKIQEEITAYEKLKDTPLSSFMIPLSYYNEEEGILVQPYFEGREIRKSIKNESLTEEETVPVLESIINFKQSWWSSQEKKEPDESLISMQRTEWEDTKKGISNTVTELSHRFAISPEALMSLPFSFEGEQYPALQTIMETVEHQLEMDPPYTVFAHNDVSGANILLKPDSDEFKIIDGEWAGQSDPAEAYVRLTKYVSTTTAKDIHNVTLQENEGVLELGLETSFPHAAIAMQNVGYEHLPLLAKQLDDPTFKERFQKYMAGSYLREMALATKRGDATMALFAMIKAGDSLSYENN